MRTLVILAVLSCRHPIAPAPADVDDDDIPDVDDRCPSLPFSCFPDSDFVDEDGCPDPGPIELGPDPGAAALVDQIAIDAAMLKPGVKLHVRGEPNGAHRAARALLAHGVAKALIVVDVVQPAAPGRATITCF